MADQHVYINGIGHKHPDNVILNSFFEKLDIGSSDDWVEERTGIKSRCSVLSKETISDLRFGKINYQDLHRNGVITKMSTMAVDPWNIAIKRARVGSDLAVSPDLIISGTSVPDYDIPANACTIAAKIEQECTAIDVNSACSSFLAGLHVTSSLIKTGAAKSVGLFNIERYSTRMDFTDRSSCILFGDGAAAALIESTKTPGSLEVIDTFLHSSPAGCELIHMAESQLFYQNGRAVQKFAITKTCDATTEMMERNNIKKEQLAYFIGHQANLRMLTTACRRLELSDKQHLYNVDQFGNQGAAGAPSVLSTNWDKIKSGDLIIVSVVGSGLTWGAALLRKI